MNAQKRIADLEQAIVLVKGLLHCFVYQHAENPAERKALFDQCVETLDKALYARPATTNSNSK